jgi:hypothetical protein
MGKSQVIYSHEGRDTSWWNWVFLKCDVCVRPLRKFLPLFLSAVHAESPDASGNTSSSHVDDFVVFGVSGAEMRSEEEKGENGELRVYRSWDGVGHTS